MTARIMKSGTNSLNTVGVPLGLLADAIKEQSKQKQAMELPLSQEQCAYLMAILEDRVDEYNKENDQHTDSWDAFYG